VFRLAALLAVVACAPVQAQQMQIQFAEKVNIAARVGHAEFDAYGRRFSLRLESNDRVLARLSPQRKAELASIHLLRGDVVGVPGSWVRLTEYAGQYEGAIWDGSDLYTVAPYRKIAPFLTNGMNAAAEQTMVYRLADTLNALPKKFCGLAKSAASRNGLTQYKQLLGEIRQNAAEAVVTDQLELSIIVDSALQAKFAPPPSEELPVTLLSAFNTAGGIFDSQVNLLLVASEYRYIGAASDPFTSNDAGTLLDQLSEFRRNTPAVAAKGIAHLFTGRTSADNTIGIAVLGGVCDVDQGVSLTFEQNGSSTIDGLIMAHEVGHNLGADHDTEACGVGLLMWPEFSMSSTLSQCALDSIRPVIAQARNACVTRAQYADASVAIDTTGPEKINGELFTFAVIPRSVGTVALTNVTVNIGISQFLTVNTASVPGGSCSFAATQVTCTIPSIAPGADPRIQIKVTSPYANSTDVSATVSATNDRYLTNNTAQGSLVVLAAADAAVAISANPTAVNTGEPIDFTVTVSAPRVRPVRDVSIDLSGDGPLYFLYDSFNPSAGCTVHVINAACVVGDLNPGETRQFVLRAIPRNAGTGHMTARVYASNDSNSRNDQATSAELTVTPVRDVGIDALPTYRLVPVGVPTDLTFLVKAGGILPINNVVVTLYPGSDNGAVQSVDIDGVACVKTNRWTCAIGTLQPGQQRVLRASALFTVVDDPGRGANMVLQVSGDEDAMGQNNDATVLVVARHAVDVTLGSTSYSADFVGRTIRINSSVYSAGIDAATNLKVSFEVPAPVEVVSATLNGGTCALDNSRKVSCTRAALAPGTPADISVDVRSAEPGTFVGHFIATADNDGLPDNNQYDWAFLVRPLTDVGILPIPAQPGYILGNSYVLTFQVFTGASDVPWVDVQLPFTHDSNTIAVDAITTTAGVCPVPDAGAITCRLGALPANALVTIAVTLRPVGSPGSGGNYPITASTGVDPNHDNDSQRVYISTHVRGDVSAAVGQATIAGTKGSLLVLPSISVNTLEHADEVFVEIPIPEFASVDSVSTVSGICTGTTVLTCHFSTRDANASDAVSVTLKLNGTGTFTSNIRGGARNDVNPANDGVTLVINSNAPATPPPTSGNSGSSGGRGGGGGGRLEWLTLALLALLVGGRLRCPPARVMYRPKSRVLRH